MTQTHGVQTTQQAGTMPEIAEQEIGAVTVAERSRQQMQAGFTMAKRFPRDETRAYTKIIKACERPGFAGEALYSFPRGDGRVEGPSVNLAREMARIFGNIVHGCDVLSTDDEYVHIEGYAVDLETNTWVREQGKFKRLIYRRGKGWVQPDERDFRELVNRHGAIHTRNCILRILPRDFIDDAMGRARETTRQVANGQIEQSREQTIRALVSSFMGLAVSQEMLEGYLGHSVNDIGADEVVDLRAIYKSIFDGNSKRGDYFTVGEKADPEKESKIEGSVSLDDLSPGTPPEKPRGGRKKKGKKKAGGKSKKKKKGEEPTADGSDEPEKSEGEEGPSEADVAFANLETWKDEMSPTQFKQILSAACGGKTSIADLSDEETITAAQAVGKELE